MTPVRTNPFRFDPPQSDACRSNAQPFPRKAGSLFSISRVESSASCICGTEDADRRGAETDRYQPRLATNANVLKATYRTGRLGLGSVDWRCEAALRCADSLNERNSSSSRGAPQLMQRNSLLGVAILQQMQCITSRFPSLAGFGQTNRISRRARS